MSRVVDLTQAVAAQEESMPEALAVVEEYRREMHRAERDEIQAPVVHLPFGGATPEAAIARLAAAMSQMDGLLEIAPRQYRAGGVLAREITMPAGSLVVSHIHLTEHLCTLSSGELTVFQTGVGTRRYEAPYTFVTAPGAQRVGFCHTEVTWTTYHQDIAGDNEKVENVLYLKQDLPEYIEGDKEALMAWIERLPALLEAGE